MKLVLVVMTGIGFTLGVVFGLLLQLPIDTSLPADPLLPGYPDSHFRFRSRRSLSDGDVVSPGVGGGSGKLSESLSRKGERFVKNAQNDVIVPRNGETLDGATGVDGASANRNDLETRRVAQSAHGGVIPPGDVGETASSESIKGNGGSRLGTKPKLLANSEPGDNPIIGWPVGGRRPNNGQIHVPREGLQRSAKENRGSAAATGPETAVRSDQAQTSRHPSKVLGTGGEESLNRGDATRQSAQAGDRGKNSALRMTINLRKDIVGSDTATNNDRRAEGRNNTLDTSKVAFQKNSEEDLAYLSTLVSGVTWRPQLESSCPRPFSLSEVEQWRRRVDSLDVVKMEEGCGRMQNRLLTLRDASKACARYRLNTDQIQGEIFSYYLARLLNISNIPPTLLVRVDALSPKWRTVHLDMSLAQWADNKLVVLTQFIPDLTPAHIPGEFREEDHRLEPTVAHLGGKSKDELCELVQWSDLIVLDYLTANLDRVINNMFNRQWNDQMMNNPAHNLEKFSDGRLVFLDNESGLFHGYRLLDKYFRYHKSLLHSLCVFRPGTVQAVKRLHASESIGSELHALFSENEALHEHLAGVPDKNVKILKQRLDDVYQQIVTCERNFNR
ncbi:four-jointed box protein 1-like [Aplysia californica]|uniref:Four-jointed box protein 1-like n=1 Tax=Aplysia californica TaxID=6500 RepID=A0ABM0K4U8_APLCA|nr:four-jointed box protein 1-like [Aplysia californica]